MKFYMTPGSCSTGIHILLEELELLYEAYVLSIPAGDLKQPDFLAINPKATLPVLITPEGRAICEFQAIAWWLARRYPKYRLLPEDLDVEIWLMEITNYVVGTIHGKGFTRIFTPESYLVDGLGRDQVEAQGRDLVLQGFEIIAAEMRGAQYINDDFSVADAALFYVEFWADRIGLPLPDRLRYHLRCMLKRLPVRQVMAEEGYREITSY